MEHVDAFCLLNLVFNLHFSRGKHILNIKCSWHEDIFYSFCGMVIKRSLIFYDFSSIIKIIKKVRFLPISNDEAAINLSQIG